MQQDADMGYSAGNTCKNDHFPHSLPQMAMAMQPDTQAKELHMARPISKAALVKDLAEATGCNHGMAREFLDVLAKVVTRRLIDGDAVMLPDLVKLEPRDRAARLVRNPATGEMMSKDADKAVTARAHNAIKAAVNP